MMSNDEEIMGTSTVDEALEKFLIDNCPRVKKKLQALNMISEVLVDISKGNYADINTAIDEIREVLEDVA